MKKKEYKAKYLKELKIKPFEAEKIAGINAPQLKQGISIQT